MGVSAHAIPVPEICDGAAYRGLPRTIRVHGPIKGIHIIELRRRRARRQGREDSCRGEAEQALFKGREDKGLPWGRGRFWR